MQADNIETTPALKAKVQDLPNIQMQRLGLPRPLHC